MKVKIKNILFITLWFCLINLNFSYADIVKKILITGNDRIADDTIKLFSNVSLNKNISKEDVNIILKNLYETNFFKDVSVSFKDNIYLY